MSEPSALTQGRVGCTRAAEEKKLLQNSKGKLAPQHSFLPALLPVTSKNQRQGNTHPRDRLWATALQPVKDVLGMSPDPTGAVWVIAV